jgi:hypothetical protein
MRVVLTQTKTLSMGQLDSDSFRRVASLTKGPGVFGAATHPINSTGCGVIFGNVNVERSGASFRAGSHC